MMVQSGYKLTMAYSQWIYMLINNLMASGNLTMKNLNITWLAIIFYLPENTPTPPLHPHRGKCFEWSDKDHEISTNKVTEQAAAPSEYIAIASCGRSDAASGTEGSFDLYDEDTKVCHWPHRNNRMKRWQYAQRGERLTR